MKKWIVQWVDVKTGSMAARPFDTPEEAETFVAQMRAKSVVGGPIPATGRAATLHMPPRALRKVQR